jgi:hypothetical protein
LSTNVIPAGSAPDSARDGVGVPVVVTVNVPAALTVNAALLALVIAGAWLTVMVSVGEVNDCGPAPTVEPAAPMLESITFTVKLAVPVAVGVPAIAPVLLVSFSPAGRVPLLTLKVRAPAPPVSAIVWL